MFYRALQLRKSILKPRGSGKPHEGTKEFQSEAELKYKMHLCYIRMNQPQDAIDILQNIPGIFYGAYFTPTLLNILM